MKKFTCAIAAILISVSACLCGACSNDEKQQQPATVTQNTQTFVTITAQIPDQVTVDYGYKIEAALLVYEYLNAAEKSNADVAAAKTRLDGLKTQYDVIKEEADRQAEAERENKRVEDFVYGVEDLPEKLKLADRYTVDELMEKYEQLKEESKEKRNVIAAYDALLEADKKITALEEAARQELIKATAEEFISAVEEIAEKIEKADNKNEAIFSEGTISTLHEGYEKFEQEVKDFTGVAQAKAKLDEMYVQYKNLHDAADVEEFLDLVATLTPVENKVTLDSGVTITKAENAYKYMSDEAKNAQGVAEAYVLLQQAREKHDELFAAAEAIKIQIFIDAANKVGTDTENVDISWFDVLDEASQAYDALAYASHSLPEVKDAYARWNAAKKVFDRKGYERIPMSDPNVIFSNDNPPHIVLQNEDNMISSLLKFYNATTLSEISDKVTVWLNVYIEGVYVARGALEATDLSHIINNTKIQGILRNLSVENPEIVSGKSFSFSLNFEDKNNEFIPSAKTKISASKQYTF